MRTNFPLIKRAYKKSTNYRLSENPISNYMVHTHRDRVNGNLTWNLLPLWNCKTQLPEQLSTLDSSLPEAVFNSARDRNFKTFTNSKASKSELCGTIRGIFPLNFELNIKQSLLVYIYTTSARKLCRHIDTAIMTRIRVIIVIVGNSWYIRKRNDVGNKKSSITVFNSRVPTTI